MFTWPNEVKCSNLSKGKPHTNDQTNQYFTQEYSIVRRLIHDAPASTWKTTL